MRKDRGGAVGGNVGHQGDLVITPNIVLIGKKNQIAGAVSRGRGEVFRKADIRAVDEDLDGKGGSLGKGFRDFYRPVTGAVITDDELVSSPRLARQAGKLLRQEGLPLIGCHDNRGREAPIGARAWRKR